MEECCDALKDDQLICVDDLGDEGGKYSRNYSKQEMAEFLKEADKLIPFDLKQICNKYESVFNDIRKEETNQVSKTTGTNFQEE